jgi:hypothetical protein
MICKIWIIHGSDYEEFRLWDIETEFVPHRRHITFRYTAQPVNTMWELRLSPVAVKNSVFWDDTLLLL